MQQRSRISPHPRTLQQAYSLTRPRPAQLRKQQSEDLRVGLGLSDANDAQKPLRLAASQPLLMQPIPPKLTISRETIDIICSTSLSDIETLQGSVTTIKDGSTASDIAEPSETSLPSIASSICLPTSSTSPFPPRSLNPYRPKRLTFEERLPFSQYPPSLFSSPTWKMMWLRKREVNLDPLTFTTTLSPSESQSQCSSPFRYEAEFTGYAYRVVVDPAKCHAGIRIQCGSIVNIAQLNTREGRYVVDACQLIRDGLLFFLVHYRIGDGQGFTSTDDCHHYSFILIVPSTYSSASGSPLLQLSAKLKPTRTFLSATMINFFYSITRHLFASKVHPPDNEKTPRPSLDLDFLPLSTPQSQQYPGDFLDITDNETFANTQRKHEYWHGRF